MAGSLAWMNVPPQATTGSSPDCASGPTSANRLFPIYTGAESVHNGRTFDSSMADYGVFAPGQNGFNVDGGSHFPVFVAENADWGPPGAALARSYTYRNEMGDAGIPAANWGNRRVIQGAFTICLT